MRMAASHAELEHLLQRRPYDRIARLMEAASRHVTDMQMNSSLSCGAVATERLRSGSARRGLARRGACHTERRARPQSIGPADSPVKVPWIILPGFIDLHDHLTWNIQPRWLTGRSLTTAMNGRIRGIGLLNNPHCRAIPTLAYEAQNQGACRWGDLGPRNLDRGSGLQQQQPVSDRLCAGQPPPARTKPIGTCCGIRLCARQLVPEGQ